MTDGETRTGKKHAIPADPLATVERARPGRFDNPVWLWNRSRRPGRFRDSLYRGIVWALWATVLLTVANTLYADFRFAPSWCILVPLLLFVAQPYLGLATIIAFDFLNGRRWVLEELSLTQLSVAAIGYGSYSPGVRASFALLAPLLAMEVWMGFRSHDPGLGVISLVFLVPTHLYLQMVAAQFSLDARSAFRRGDALLWIATPIQCLFFVALCLGIAYFAMAISLGLLFPFLEAAGPFGEVIAFVVPLLIYLAILSSLAIHALHQGWRQVSINLYGLLRPDSDGIADEPNAPPSSEAIAPGTEPGEFATREGVVGETPDSSSRPT